jgi:hypothetical protein
MLASSRGERLRDRLLLVELHPAIPDRREDRPVVHRRDPPEGEVSALTEAILQLSRILNLHAVARHRDQDQLNRLLQLHPNWARDTSSRGRWSARPSVASGPSLRSDRKQAI